MIAQISQGDLVELCAVDSDLFCHTYFPKAFRDQSPDFDRDVWKALENPKHRLLNLRIFRGGAKTTKLRAYAAKRIAYGVSRTILYIGASESHATRSVQWLRSQIEPRMGGDGKFRATNYAQTFGLKPGKKWQEHEIEVVQSVPRADGTTEERVYWMLGVGITGSIRGINFDDYRPDLIIIDDAITDENAATEEQRNKVSDLVMGALKNSLAPATEEPNAKLVMLQTPLDANDASARAEKSAEWHTESFGCWTKATEDLPSELQRSSWENRYPTPTLQKEKKEALIDNRYSVFAREMECKLTTAETMSFLRPWLRKYHELPKIGATVISIDPVPPPSDKQLARGLKGKDFEAISAIGRTKDGYYLLSYDVSKGHDPEWTASKFFEYKLRFRPQCCVLSLVSAERYLKWFLEKEMGRRRNYLPIKEAPIGGKSKFARITSALSGVASQGKLFCHDQHAEFILQFESYGIGYKGNDDLLESVANGVAELTNPFLELGGGDYSEVDDVPELNFVRACP